MNTEKYKEAWAFATRFCSQSEHCQSEINQKIKRFELTSGEIENLFEALKAEKYWDNYRYAKAFVNDKICFAKWGKLKIQYKLQEKGISKKDIEKALECFDTDEYNRILLELLKQKKSMLKNDNEFELNGKISRFALSKGFEYDQIKSQMKLLNALKDD
jgi:regulatory protein